MIIPTEHSALHRWVAEVLSNDEASDDAELIALFVAEGPMGEAEARFYVGQRQKALLTLRGFSLELYRPNYGSTTIAVGDVPALPEPGQVSATMDR